MSNLIKWDLEFDNFCNHYNKLWINVKYYEWDREITFLHKFIEVMWDYQITSNNTENRNYIIIDNNIWFITDRVGSFFIEEEFLDFCIENDLRWIKAFDFYDFMSDLIFKLSDNNWWVPIFIPKKKYILKAYYNEQLQLTN